MPSSPSQWRRSSSTPLVNAPVACGTQQPRSNQVIQYGLFQLLVFDLCGDQFLYSCMAGTKFPANVDQIFVMLGLVILHPGG